MAARALPGVVAVVTAEDLRGLYPRFGHIVADHPILAIEKVRYFGEPVVLVVAETHHQAADGAALVEIQYEDLPFVVSAHEAEDPDSPLLHQGSYDRGDSSFDEAVSNSTGHNIAHEVEMGWGDVDAAMENASLVVETTMAYPMLYAYAMEPYNATAIFDGGRLHVISSAQHPFQVRDDLARIFSLPLASVRVESRYIGGGYGSKSYTKVEPLAAVAAYLTNRPVQLMLGVEESMYTTRADSATVSVRSAFDQNGVIHARQFDIVLNSGAYADNSPLVLAKAANRCFGPYKVPNLRVTGRCVYTNTIPASSYRGFGAPQGALAGEVNLDQAAELLDLDAAGLRRVNLLKPGDVLLPGKRPLDADVAADLDLLVDTLYKGYELRGNNGVGFGCTASDAGAFPVSTAVIKLLTDGSVLVMSGSTELGQGSRTVLGQIAAEELGVGPEDVVVIQGDTALTPYERTTGASRTTTLTGMAVVRACNDALDKIRQMAAEALGVSPDDIESARGGVKSVDGQVTSYAEVIQGWFGATAGEVTGIGVVRPHGEHALLPPFWEIGVAGVEVSVDESTGQTVIEHLVTIGDVGYAINPALVEGQDLGAATQGLGAALFEEILYDGPQPANPNVVDYRVPRMSDMPGEIHTILAERQDGIGPYGAKGAGEGALNPIGGAVVSAVARAVGAWPDTLPLTPERVWRIMQQEQQQ
jgi:CO/xanthine dehydrogenase Mo-binding subunit